MSDIHNTLNTLQQQLSPNSWFDSVEIDPYGRIVVYVHRMDAAVANYVPEVIDNHRVLLGYATSKMPNHVKIVSFTTLDPMPLEMELPDEEIFEDDLPNISEELIKLERLCGLNMLRSIFYELHDGKNAITNVSAKYPQVRRGLEELYEIFGFDLLWEKIEK